MRCLIVFLLAFLFTCARAGDTMATVMAVDTTHVRVTKFDPAHIDKYKSQRDFNYDNTPHQGNGLMAVLLYFILNILEGLDRAHVGPVSIYQLLFYGLALFASAAVIMYFFNVKVTGLFSKSAGSVVTHKSFTENVHEIDFDKMISDSLSANNFRLAVRLYYLKCLKNLSDSGYINWQKNKTNTDYYYELKDPELRKQFYNLTGVFEYAWYGEREVSATEFNENQQAFTAFLQTLKPQTYAR